MEKALVNGAFIECRPTAGRQRCSCPKRALTFLDSSTGRSRVVTVIDKLPKWFLSVFPDGKRILYSQVDQSNSDLYLVENFR
jgi:hypothetical protein